MDPLLNHKVLRRKKIKEGVNIISTTGVDIINPNLKGSKEVNGVNPNLTNSITNSWTSWVNFFLKSSIENLNVYLQSFLEEASLL